MMLLTNINTLYVDKTGTCQGKFEAVCGESEVSLTRYEDYSCQGGKDNGYPMSFTTSCGYANSLGFSKYGFASCSEASSSSSESIEGDGVVLEASTGDPLTRRLHRTNT